MGNVDERKAKIDAAYKKVLNRMIMEEIRSPGTFKTKMKTLRVTDDNKRTSEVINSWVYHMKQIINTVTQTKNGYLIHHFIMYWVIDDVNNEIYKKVEASIDSGLQENEIISN